MTGKFLGKIVSAEYGIDRDYPCNIGIKLNFQFDRCYSITDGCKYMINLDEECGTVLDSQAAIASLVDLYKLLEDAKVQNVSELENCPVEVEIDDNIFKGFRILTEVL